MPSISRLTLISVHCRHVLTVLNSVLNVPITRWNMETGTVAHIPEPSIPNHNKDHAWTYEDGTMQPLWTSGDVLLKHLVDILESTAEDTQDSEGEDNSNMDETDSSDSDTYSDID